MEPRGVRSYRAADAPFSDRIQRLEESCDLARQWFDKGIATVHGRRVHADELPLAPVPDTPPRVFVGGGSDRLLEIAGRYADAIDLNGSSRAGKLGGPAPMGREVQRRLSTTVSDLESAVRRVRDGARGAGRDGDAIRVSFHANYLAFCSDAEAAERQRQLCEQAGIDVDLDQCPYVLMGTPERMRGLLAERKERLGLDAVIAGGPDLGRFIAEVADRI